MTKWVVKRHPDFIDEFGAMPPEVQTRLISAFDILAEVGPELGRPLVDTLIGSRFANMKEIRVQISNGYWRVAFAFDPARQAVVLVGGNKGGLVQSRFYAWLIRVADRRFTEWLERQEQGET